jgi:CRP/FNR family transcriptional regulator, cyclic AMP receptor protein
LYFAQQDIPGIMSQILKTQIEQIVALTEAEFEQVLSYFTPRKFKRYQFVVQEGQRVEEEFFVLEGLVKAYYINEAGKEHIIQFALENWWITDYQALINHEKAKLNIDCIEETSLLSITLDNKNKLCAALHKMEHFFRIKSNFGYVSLQKRILSLLNDDAKTRYEEFIEKYPSLTQRIPKALIASYLGVSRETLSRLSPQ